MPDSGATPITRKGTFLRTLMHAEDGFMINRYRLTSELPMVEVSVKGYALPSIGGVTIKFIGGEIVNETRGERTYLTLKDAAVIPDYESAGASAAIMFLTSVHGIGNKIAARIVHVCPDTFTTLTEAVNLHAELADKDSLPEDVRRLVENVPVKKLAAILTAWEAQSIHRELYEFLGPKGLPEKIIHKIIGKFGDEAMEKIKDNPYRLTGFSDISFTVADKLAADLGLPRDNPKRIEAGVFEVLFQAEHGGHTFSFGEAGHSYIIFETLVEKLTKLLGGRVEGAYGRPLSEKLIALHDEQALRYITITVDKVTESKDATPVGDRTSESKEPVEEVQYAVYSNSAYEKEKAIAEGLALACAPPLDDALIERAISRAESKNGITLAEKQREAVIMAARNPVSIMTGGAGTGKTTALKCVIDVVESIIGRNAEVVLLAPTGRAAKRMSQTTGRYASTIHKALKLVPSDSKFEFTDPGESISADLVVVDEMSMVGNTLMANLMKAIDRNTRILFVGDTAQLPSIEAGRVLADMIVSGALPMTRLNVVQRQALDSSVNYNATIIRRGLVGKTPFMKNEDFVFVSPPRYLDGSVSEWIAEKAKEVFMEEAASIGLENVCMLSPYRQKTVTGSDSLNREIQKAYNPADTSLAETEESGKQKSTKLKKGDKVMFTKNEGNLTNGEIGYVTEVSKFAGELTVIVRFEDGEEYSFTGYEETSKLILAYAMSVHKSQGSEYQTVILIMDKLHMTMHEWHLLYTGITRAKVKLIIIGEEDTFIEGVKKAKKAIRNSRLSQKIIREVFKRDRKNSLKDAA